jgi:hypothetical protein
MQVFKPDIAPGRSLIQGLFQGIIRILPDKPQGIA